MKLQVSALGLGCWPIGGAVVREGRSRGYTGVDDAESLRAIAAAVDLGVTLFDTADAYGAGHSERLLGRALAGHPEVAVATKFGNTLDEETQQLTGVDTSPAYVRRAVHASLRRLNRDRVDIYQLHTPDAVGERAAELVTTLEELVAEGLIGWYGVSATAPGQVETLAGPHLAVVQVEMNVLDGTPATAEAAEKLDLGVLCRSPLAMGILGGRHDATTRLPPEDVRAQQLGWLRWFDQGTPTSEVLRRLDAIRDVLTASGRSLAQGALAWIWADSPRAVPLPGFRTVAHIQDTAAAMRHGPLTPAEHDEVERLLGRPARQQLRLTVQIVTKLAGQNTCSAAPPVGGRAHVFQVQPLPQNRARLRTTPAASRRDGPMGDHHHHHHDPPTGPPPIHLKPLSTRLLSPAEIVPATARSGGRTSAS